MIGPCYVLNPRTLKWQKAVARGIVPNEPFVRDGRVSWSPNAGRVWLRGLSFCVQIANVLDPEEFERRVQYAKQKALDFPNRYGGKPSLGEIRPGSEGAYEKVRAKFGKIVEAERSKAE